MTKMEVRYPCPVCLGVKMEKVTLSSLVLDHCPRCGGVWFEMGEVQHLRRIDPAELWGRIVQRTGVHSMQCHSCSAHVPRTEARCHACDWKIELDCPVCARKMEVAVQGDLRLDFCKHCKGVWFDHDELTTIWNLEVTALMQRQDGTTAGGIGEGVLGALMYDPFTMYYGMHAAGYAVSGAAEMLSNAPELIAAAPEVASSLFETIVEIITGLFDM